MRLKARALATQATLWIGERVQAAVMVLLLLLLRLLVGVGLGCSKVLGLCQL